ncbi:hypothetical protein G7Y79_00036g072180 [Physcia stellaris]|nr:hypothetical protein G7Y79_00036g072180 [Physcia stellaris]
MYTTIPLSLFFLSLTGSGMACSTVSGIKFTAYGFPDASGIPAYKCNGNTVTTTGPNDRTQLGDGSFGKPYAAAAARNSIFQRCELLYMPLLKKYFRVQDDCSGCVAKQTDLYIAQSNQDIGQTSCEQQFGTFNIGRPLHDVIRSPGNGFEVLTKPLFDNNTKKCYNNPSDGRVFPNRDGQVQCSANGNELFSTASVDTTADDTPMPSSPLDSDPAARHSGMKPIPSGSAKFRA